MLQLITITAETSSTMLSGAASLAPAFTPDVKGEVPHLSPPRTMPAWVFVEVLSVLTISIMKMCQILSAFLCLLR